MRSTFQQIQDGLKAHLNSVSQAKTAASAEQIIDGEKPVKSVPSDKEVKDIVPSIAVPPEPKKDLITERGNETGKTSDGTNLNPPKEEKERKEVKVGSLDHLPPLQDLDKVQGSLAENLKIAAGLFGKTSTETAPEKKEAATSLNSPETVSDKSLGNNATADTSGSTPKIEGIKTVTQTNPKPNASKEDTKPSQGAELTSPESKVAAADIINIEDLSKKMASFAQDVQHGKQMAHDVIEMMKLANSKEYREFHEKADTLKIAAAADAIASLTSQAAEQGLITPAQADQLMKFAGFEENPIHVAIRDLQHKIALLQNSNLDENQKQAFIKKANDPTAEVEGMPESTPVSPDELRGSVENLISQLDAAVQSGQITEEQAIQVLQEQGIPVGGAEGGAAPEGEMDEGQIEQIQTAFLSMLEQLQAAVESGQITEEQALEALRQQGIPIDEIMAAAIQEQQAGGEVEPTMSADPSMGSAPEAPAAPTPAEAPETPTPDDTPKTASAADGEFLFGNEKHRPPAQNITSPQQAVNTSRAKAFAPNSPKAIQFASDNLNDSIAAETREFSPEQATDLAEASGALPTIAGDNKITRPANATSAEEAIKSQVPPQTKNPDFWKYVLGGGGLGLIGLGAHSLISKDDDEEEKKRKRARLEEPDAKEKISKLASGIAAFCAKTANAASLDSLLAELENAVAGGLISQEQAEAIVQVLAAQPAAAPAAAPVA